jgi:4-hydroxybenzoate polyprenyltransferase
LQRDQGENQLTSIISSLKAYSKISRFEYLPGVAPGLLLPILIGINSIENIFSWILLEAVFVFMLLYFSGFIINSLVDRDIDKKYKTFKGNISESVDLLGTSKVKAILFVQVFLAAVLGIHLMIILENFLVIVLVGFGILFGLGYSAQPFHFKVKGIWHAVALASSAFFIPLMFIYIVVAETIEVLDILLIMGITIAHYSMEMANQAADHLEDSAEGLTTPTVRLGLDKALKSSIIMTTVGMVWIIFVVALMYITAGLSGIAGLELSGLPFPAISLMLLMVAVVIAIGYYFPIKGLKDLYQYSIEPTPIEERIAQIKARIRYATWQATGIIGVVLTLGILFTASFTNPVIESYDTELDTASSTELDINSLRIANVKVTTGNEGQSDNYADVTVRLDVSNIDVDEKQELTKTKAFVKVGTAKDDFNSAQGSIDTNGRATIRIDLEGYNETKVWYIVYLMYNGQQSSYIWTERSVKNLYMFNARLDITDGILSNWVHMDLTVQTFNAGKAREPNSIKIKVEWVPPLGDTTTNNATIYPSDIWEAKISRDILKTWLSDSPTFTLYLIENDIEVDVLTLAYY